MAVVALFAADPITGWLKVFRVERLLNSIPQGTGVAEVGARMKSIPWVEIVVGSEPACRLRVVTRRRRDSRWGSDILWTAQMDEDQKLVSFIKGESVWLSTE